jgi:hypothetical protein
MSRKLIRPSLSSPPRGPSRPTRGTQAENVSAEPGYLLQAIESKTEFVVRFLGGGEIRGRLEAYDRDSLAVRDASGTLHLARKARIGSYFMDRPPKERPSVAAEPPHD